MGPAQRTLCKPRQDREVAAVAESSLVLQVSLARANCLDNAGGAQSKQGARSFFFELALAIFEQRMS